ncbi:MAG: hypothetical protein SFT92_03295 [Rickettsiales bacterium]|nr:hypothetical protein [Rickettsiales bacterium]
MHRFLAPALMLLAFMPGSAFSQAKPTLIINGQQVSKASSGGMMDEADKSILEAAKHVMEGDYRGAERIYSDILSRNDSNVEAHVQRAIVRRELKNPSGVQSDALTAVQLASAALQTQPRSYSLYYQRSQALRLLGEFDKAKADLLKARKLAGGNRWSTDLQAIEMERRIAKSQIQP